MVYSEKFSYIGEYGELVHFRGKCDKCGIDIALPSFKGKVGDAYVCWVCQQDWEE
ncbi:MAG: hypothetical protein DDT19_00886 [Syntrophomonadaceae bacterium]|nr:hypothetical protein [Bacillota bacterium]